MALSVFTIGLPTLYAKILQESAEFEHMLEVQRFAPKVRTQRHAWTHTHMWCSPALWHLGKQFSNGSKALQQTTTDFGMNFVGQPPAHQTDKQKSTRGAPKG